MPKQNRCHKIASTHIFGPPQENGFGPFFVFVFPSLKSQPKHATFSATSSFHILPPQVASIPLSCCLSSDPADAPHGSLRALAHAALEGLPTLARPAFQSTEAALDKDMVSVTLQVFLECTAGAFSEFAPWMGMLPRGSDLNLPALWPEDDLRPLEGTLVSREVRQCLTAAEVERRQVEASIVSVVGREGDDGGWGSGGEFLREVLARGGGTLEGRPTWAEWLHARCIVQSRAYRVGKR